MLPFRNPLIALLCFLSFASFSQKQDNICRRFFKLSGPEKCWVLGHPFIAKRTWQVSSRVREVSAGIINDNDLDGDISGGQADAFRHALWMAALCREIHWRKALRLGEAHERGNKIEFRKGRKEDGYLPDKASCEMDLFNNQYGILLGKQWKNIPEDELKAMIKKAVLAGDLKVIKKDRMRNSLDENGNVIADWEGKWENRRVLVSSDYLNAGKTE